MHMVLTPYAIALFIATLVAAMVAVPAWGKRSIPGGLPLALLMLAEVVMAGASTLEAASVETTAKITDVNAAAQQLLGVTPSAIGQSAGVVATPRVIYDDALAAGWLNYSWATVNLSAASPIHSGAHSIAVTYGAWQGLYLANPGLSTAGYTWLRFFIHGGSTGGQQLHVFVEQADGSYGPDILAPTPVANAWTQVQIPLADLGAADTIITGIIWQGWTNGSQPTLYIDDIALVANEDPNGPVLSDAKLMRSAAPADGVTGVVVKVRASDPQGAGDLASVSLDARSIGRGTVVLHDDGRSNDGAAGDGVYGGVFTVAPGTSPGETVLVVSAQDQAGHIVHQQLGAFVVLPTGGGSIPTVLPHRPAWGTDEWDERPGYDWQVNSGVPWDYVYQYITYEWYTDGWGGNFVARFVQQAWSKGFIPVISVYMILGLPPTCDETPECYAQKLQNPTAVSNYLAALHEAASQANGNQPVIFQLEPDFYGYMQQYSNSSSRPPGVRPDDPASYPVALDITGYPDDLTGFGRRMVDVIHTAAPNALVAPHASMWATNNDPNNVPAAEAVSMAQRTATFINAMGGVQADLLFVEWSDRDAGSGLRPWWDDTNHVLPHVSRAVLWESALSAAAGKRLILWQVPVGNMSLNDTCDHYRDNRAAYAFSHPRDLFDAGVIAVLFGGGATCMTRPSTDGGFVQAQGSIAYASPVTPMHLIAGPLIGDARLPLQWDENTEPNLWGYRVSYARSGSGVSYTLDVGPANSTSLLLPSAGKWQVRVQAYDAMGQPGPLGNSVVVTTSLDLPQVFLPVVER